MTFTPNFAHWRATVLHRPDSNTDKLIRQLRLLGFVVEITWAPPSADAIPDLLLVDADQGWDGLLPWQGADAAPCPLVAMLASEAPSRIAWALEQGAGAILAKPLNTSAVYPALVMASARYQERVETRERISYLEERLRLRPLVYTVVRLLVERGGMTEDEAYAVLRSSAMQQRLPLETIAASILAGTQPMPETG
jgi:AmiR/NasT family two-component response regulator